DATPGGPFIVTATSKASAFTKDTRSFYITDVTGISFFRTDYEVRPGGKINIIPNVQVVGYAPNTVNWEYDEDIVESIDSDIDGNIFTIKADAPYGTYPITARS